MTLPVDTLANTSALQLANNLAVSNSSNGLGGSLTNVIHTVVYLIGFDNFTNDSVYNSNIGVVSSAAANAGGSYQNCTLQATYPYSRGGFQAQPGHWVLATLPTYLYDNGQLALDDSLQAMAFTKLIGDANTGLVVRSNFHLLNAIRVFDANNNLVISGSPAVGDSFIPQPPLVPFSPIGDVQQGGNQYSPTGLHFDGATGLVTTENLVTAGTGVISFAGWFNIDTSLSGTLEFSNGNGSSSLKVDLSAIPTPGAWCHLMGTIDANAGQTLVAVNALPAPQMNVGSAFGDAPTNGKPLYIGMDTLGGFFKGDIADLSIWFDYTFFVNNQIPDYIVAKFVQVDFGSFLGNTGITTISPINPYRTLFGNLELFKPYVQNPTPNPDNIMNFVTPDVFLSGPAATALTPTLPLIPGNAVMPAVLNLETVTGTLTNSATNPGPIEIIPT